MKNRIHSILTASLLMLLISTTSNAQVNGDTTGTRRQQGRFITGGTSSVTRLEAIPGMNCGVSKVSFGKGARTIWHSHAGGQVIVVLSGTAWYQEKGKPKQILKQGEAIMAAPGAMHWHGATLDSAMVHTVATPNLDRGGVTNGSPVTDQEYAGIN